MIKISLGTIPGVLKPFLDRDFVKTEVFGLDVLKNTTSDLSPGLLETTSWSIGDYVPEDRRSRFLGNFFKNLRAFSAEAKNF